MGRSLLPDRHGIFVRFSRRKITWLGVICITELDLVTRHYPLPLPQPHPQQTQTHGLCALPSLHHHHHHHPSPAYIKQQITKLTFPTVLTLPSQFWAETLSNLPENKSKRENVLWVHAVVCVFVCIMRVLHACVVREISTCCEFSFCVCACVCYCVSGSRSSL